MNESITKEKAGANAWLYMAHSYYALGQRKLAEETYQKLKDNFAGTPQASSIQKVRCHFCWPKQLVCKKSQQFFRRFRCLSGVKSFSD